MYERFSYWVSLRKEIFLKVVEFYYEICRMLLCYEIQIFYIFFLIYVDEEVFGVIVFMEKLMVGC